MAWADLLPSWVSVEQWLARNWWQVSVPVFVLLCLWLLRRSRSGEPDRTELTMPAPLSRRAIAVGSLLVLIVGVAAVTLLLRFYGGGAPKDQLDAIRTAGTIVVGTGGAVALLLTARRQRSMELTLKHQEQVAADTSQDAAERRVTELYTKAVEQLGADNAMARVGALYALERLAESAPEQRDTVIEVVCAYLRMPYQAQDEEFVRERQARLAATSILHRHRSGVGSRIWETRQPVDLSGANLTDADLGGIRLVGGNLIDCDLEQADLGGANLTSGYLLYANLKGAYLDGAVLHRATLEHACLEDAELSGAVLVWASLRGAQLGGARWSGQTRWPRGLRALVRAASTEGVDGSYRIQAGWRVPMSLEVAADRD
ncbi:pentapeptide repeat-containing protein [Amycolatopsis nigrescens]|uniref:pentapeptide repeat-containing protein n=1 Tax=Amycolatopsis nigrescens TaxID=381445 RepID=UPI00038249E4|nr:pentapeptide repeat-containing protein [Amycolatopsis nigrescens]